VRKMNTQKNDTTAYECIHTSGLDNHHVPITISVSNNFEYTFKDFYTLYAIISESSRRMEDFVVNQEVI